MNQKLQLNKKFWYSEHEVDNYMQSRQDLVCRKTHTKVGDTIYFLIDKVTGEFDSMFLRTRERRGVFKTKRVYFLQ